MLRRSLLVVVLLLTLVSSWVGGVYTSFADDAIGRGDGLLFGFHHHHDIGDPESEASDESLMHQVLDHASLTPTMCSVYTLVCGALCFDRPVAVQHERVSPLLGGWRRPPKAV
jgi:hypothetical protein|tara:strand:- start:1535 stop:1873 length:339 start_codon:yes stop_codon:yes gene_type:complete